VEYWFIASYTFIEQVAQYYTKRENEMVFVIIHHRDCYNIDFYAHQMILIYLIGILLAGAFLAWITGKKNSLWPRIISLVSLGIDLIFIILFVYTSAQSEKDWLIDIKYNWIPAFGISLHLALDGLSLVMLILTFFLGIISVIISWREIDTKSGFFHFNLLLILAGITGVFLSLDLFLFYFFWELMLVPMYFLIGIWGHENRTAAANKFFLYTQASGLLMLIAIIALFFIHGYQDETGFCRLYQQNECQNKQPPETVFAAPARTVQ